MKSKPLVSVAVVTFNHEKYIAQAIESALMQRTNFNFEIVIGEDGSVDNTRAIVEKYSASFPDRIRVFLHESNLGSGGRINSMITLKACEGKYISILEGDDFWTDPLKLQKQADVLDNNPDVAICFHNSKIINEDDPEKITFSNSNDQPELSKFEDLAKGEFIYTATSMFRSNDFQKFKRKYNKYLNNYTLDLHNAQFGSIRYINEVMSVYRKHEGGAWSMVAREKTLIDQLPTYKFYIYYFDKKFRNEFKKHLKDMTSELISLKMRNADFSNFWKYYVDYVFYNFKGMKDFKHMASIFLLVINSKFKKLGKQ